MYSQIFVGGTFDRLHQGHEFLLTEAFRRGQKVIIGLTTDKFVQKFKIEHSFQIQGYGARKKALETWLRTTIKKKLWTIIPIDDPYEPAASLENIDAIIVTPENKARGKEINSMRKKRGLTSLAITQVPIVHAEDGGVVSSTRIRNGDIDCAGNLVMPESLRHILARPLGKVLTGGEILQSILHHAQDRIITVGDVTTKTVLDAGLVPNLSIIDLRVGRKDYDAVYKLLNQPEKVSPFQAKFLYVKSGPGYISEKARQAIRANLAKQGTLARQARQETQHALPVIVVDGEEDLLVLPVVIYAANGSIVYYGQPGEGVVEVVVTREKKRESEDLLERFE